MPFFRVVIKYLGPLCGVELLFLGLLLASSSNFSFLPKESQAHPLVNSRGFNFIVGD